MDNGGGKHHLDKDSNFSCLLFRTEHGVWPFPLSVLCSISVWRIGMHPKNYKNKEELLNTEWAYSPSKVWAPNYKKLRKITSTQRNFYLCTESNPRFCSTFQHSNALHSKPWLVQLNMTLILQGFMFQCILLIPLLFWQENGTRTPLHTS